MWGVEGLDFILKGNENEKSSCNFVAVMEGEAHSLPAVLQGMSVGATYSYNDRLPCFAMDGFTRIELIDGVVGKTTVEHNHSVVKQEMAHSFCMPDTSKN